jgi:hypothetical protein
MANRSRWLFVLVAIALGTAQPLRAPAQGRVPAGTQGNTATDSRTDKIKVKVAKIGPGHEATITLNNGDSFHGSIQNVEDDNFKVYEVDLKQLVEFKYTEVKKMESGYGHSRDIYGRRIPPRKHKIGLAIGLAAILVPILIILPALKD